MQRAGLWLASVPYGWAVRCRNLLYEHGWKRGYRAPVPVVSIGNLTLGGTGKTPCVEYVSRLYRRHGWQVAILSRGYASDRGRNDEALVLEENLPDVPHLQGPDRAALARIAVEELESDVLVLDDGFQHRRLHRDLDIVLIDATNPWGHGYLFPRGLLREPRSSLRRAGAVILTRCDQVKATARARLRKVIARLAPDRPVTESVHQAVDLGNAEQQTCGLDILQSRPIAAFCGIGNPEAFRETLQRLGAACCDFRIFPDHHRYSRADVDSLRDWSSRQPGDCLIVTTQKDLVKIRLSVLGSRPLWALRIQMRLETGQDLLDRKLMGALSPDPGRSPHAATTAIP